MHYIKDFIDSLDCPGSHILVCVILGLIGATFSIYGHTDVGKSFLEFLPIAAYAMRGTDKANNKPQDDQK